MSLNVTASTQQRVIVDDEDGDNDVKGGKFALAAEGDGKEKHGEGKENDGGRSRNYSGLSAQLLGRRRLVTTAS